MRLRNAEPSEVVAIRTSISFTEDFFLECLAGNSASRPLEIEKRLLQLAPGWAVCSATSLDLDEYHRLGHCRRSLRSDVRPATSWRWGGEEHDALSPYEHHAVWDVVWQDQALVVVEIGWDSSCGQESRYWVLAQDLSIAHAFLLDAERKTNDPGEAILVFSHGHWQRNPDLFRATQEATFDDLVLAGELKATLRADFARFLDARERYEGLGLAWRRGALFLGPPGNGKTHCLRALVRELSIPSLYVQSLSHPHVPSEILLAQVFCRARKLRPCILIFEDLDALVTPANRAYFLNQLDGFEKNVGLMVIGTTNHPERIDPAIVDRPSRFDRKYVFGLPGPVERLEYLQHWQRQLGAETGWRVEELGATVQETQGFSFAYLKELVVSSLLSWLAASPQPFCDALSRQVVELRAQMSTGRDFTDERPIAEESDRLKRVVELSATG